MADNLISVLLAILVFIICAAIGITYNHNRFNDDANYYVQTCIHNNQKINPNDILNLIETCKSSYEVFKPKKYVEE